MSSASPHYALLNTLGHGGFGSVHRTVHHPTGLTLAVKVLRSVQGADGVRLWMGEATAVAKVRHPHVVQLLDAGRSPEGTAFLAMELIEGHDLEAWLHQWPGWAPVARVLLEVLDGLAAAHAVSVVHRDLKPANILVEGRSGAAKLVDFGIATVSDPLEEQHDGVFAGTPEFMAPEQLAGDAPLGPWTDLYAFGVLLAYAVRGRSPFPASVSVREWLKVKRGYVAPLEHAAREGLGVPRELQELVDELLAPDLRARPRFAAEVRARLAALSVSVDDVRVSEGMNDLEDFGAHEATTLVRPDETDVTAPTAWASKGASLMFEDTRDAFAPPSMRAPMPTALPAPDDPRLSPTLLALRDAPFVGRSEAREALRAASDRVCQHGRSELVLIVGEPGVGKTRLARFGLEDVERRGTMERAATAYDLGGVGVGGGLRHVVARLVGKDASVDALRWLERLDPTIDLERVAAFVASAQSDSRATHEQIVALAHRVLRAASRVRPIYLWLDDIAWARDGAQDLVDLLLDDADARVLIVLTLRAATGEHVSVRTQLAPLFARAERIELAPLSHEAQCALIQGLAPIDPSVADELATALGGSPLLAVQLVQDWVATGRLVVGNARYELPADRTFRELWIERPAHRALDARLDRFLATFGVHALEAEAILIRAALLGRSFEATTLQSTCDADVRTRLPEVVDRALFAGLIRQQDGWLSFEYGFVAEALLERLERRRDRDAMLRATAAGLENRFGASRADVAASVAALLRRAGDVKVAWTKILFAIERFALLGDDANARTQLAAAHAWRAEDDAREGDAPRAELELVEGRVHYLATRYDEAEAGASRARVLAVGRGDLGVLARADALSADIAFYRERYDEAERRARAVLPVALASEEPDVLRAGAHAAWRLADLAAMRFAWDDAVAMKLTCRELAHRSGVPHTERVAMLGIAECSMACGREADARHWVRRSREAAQEADDADHVALADEIGAYLDLVSAVDAPNDVELTLSVQIDKIAAMGDRWHLTALRIGSALAAALLHDDATTRDRVLAMLAAFEVIANDGPLEVLMLERLAQRLAERGLAEEAKRVAALHASRVDRKRTKPS